MSASNNMNKILQAPHRPYFTSYYNQIPFSNSEFKISLTENNENSYKTRKTWPKTVECIYKK